MESLPLFDLDFVCFMLVPLPPIICWKAEEEMSTAALGVVPECSAQGSLQVVGGGIYGHIHLAEGLCCGGTGASSM